MVFGRQELEQMIKIIFKIDTVPGMIDNQINRFIKNERFTFLEIGRALKYYVEVQKGIMDIRYGIAIVKTIMPDVKRYYAKKEQEELKQKLAASSYKEKKQKAIVCKTPQKMGKEVVLLDLTKLGGE